MVIDHHMPMEPPLQNAASHLLHLPTREQATGTRLLSSRRIWVMIEVGKICEEQEEEEEDHSFF